MENIPPIIHQSWHPHLQPLFDDPKMVMLKDILFGPNRHYSHPEKKNIFRVFSMPLDKIKVVIIGQDPYPNGEGIGLAFAVNSAAKMPASLKVIKKEVDKSEHLYFKPHTDVMWQTLEHWVEQGVFLLNSALTVQDKMAASHLGYWHWFTREVVRIISEDQPSLWLLWGAKAKGFKDHIVYNTKMTENNVHDINPTNGVFEADHPAAELYPGSTAKFSGCNHFNLVNQILEHRSEPPIKW